jgi:hypothetical protein
MQGRQVVEDPKRTTLGGHDQVALLDEEVHDGCTWQVLLERLPVLAVVERHEDTELGAGV